MLDPQTEGYSRSATDHAEIQKAFDLRAKCRLELEFRLDRFEDAVAARGGRVLAVSRGRAASGRYFAAVRFSLPLPREAPPPGQSNSTSRRAPEA
jgi:hypothetical protein